MPFSLLPLILVLITSRRVLSTYLLASTLYLVAMSTSPDTTPVTVSRATQTEDDWSEIKADVKKLVEAVQSLVPPPKPIEPW